MILEVVKSCKTDQGNHKSGDKIEVSATVGEKLIRRGFAALPKPKAKAK
tara:strand:- start:13 stop:159 length:147 start_codon:yes stop_codon:yes gene_type:complete